MTKPARETKIRLNLELIPQVRLRLENLRVRTGADSLAEVIRRALAVYEIIVNIGNQEIFIRNNGKETKIIIV